MPNVGRDSRYIKKVLEKNEKKLNQFLKKKNRKKTKLRKKTQLFNSQDGLAFKNIKLDLYYPLEKNTFWISARFGMRYNSKKKRYEMHHGVDFAAPHGSPVKSSAHGIVEFAGFDPKGFGNYVVINHGNDIKTRYAHLSKIIVKLREEVSRGSIIGLVGATGNTRGKHSGAHLHFELIDHHKRCNPLQHLMW